MKLSIYKAALEMQLAANIQVDNLRIPQAQCHQARQSGAVYAVAKWTAKQMSRNFVETHCCILLHESIE